MTQIRQLSFSQVCLSGGGWGCELFEAQSYSNWGMGTLTQWRGSDGSSFVHYVLHAPWEHKSSVFILMSAASCTASCMLHGTTSVQSSSWWMQLCALCYACYLAPQELSLHPFTLNNHTHLLSNDSRQASALWSRTVFFFFLNKLKILPDIKVPFCLSHHSFCGVSILRWWYEQWQ